MKGPCRKKTAEDQLQFISELYISNKFKIKELRIRNVKGHYSSNHEVKEEYTGNQRALELEVDYRVRPNPVGECNRFIGFTPSRHHSYMIII
jgi:hypothetical protein